MTEAINEKVSILMLYNRQSRQVKPEQMRWQGRLVKFSRLAFHHTIREGKKLIHIFSVSNGTMDFRLSLDTETLFWTLEEVSDGLAS
jgi:hypothetical protein